MANNELGIRFTENNYLTRSEVSRELKMTLIDNIWNNILSYRSNFNKYLSLKSIDKKSFVVCFCNSIERQVNDLSLMLTKFRTELLSYNSFSNSEMGLELKFEILKKINNFRQINVADDFIRNILKDDISIGFDDASYLLFYNKCLKYIEQNYINPLDKTYVFDLYNILTNNKNFANAYRTSDDYNPNNRILINKIYSSAPHDLINDLMSSLFYFINTSTISNIIKGSVAYYYINYIKPFKSHNEEMAVLIAKSILAHGELSEFAPYLPFEKLINRDVENVQRIFFEVQKTSDVTYFLTYFMSFIEKDLTSIFDEINQKKMTEVKKDFYREDDNTKIIDEDNNETLIIKEDSANDLEKDCEKIETDFKKDEVKVQNNYDHIVINKVVNQSKENNPSDIEKYLLQTNPLIKKGQAKFYSKHCTAGHFYTIEDYKKFNRCVYETARTSMDSLVNLGYYKKEKVNNKKFVYYPIKKD